ncbi:MAG: response regulator [Anaerolineae bacterium]|nr:response regulator [Anaerolineae bacterium]
MQLTSHARFEEAQRLVGELRLRTTWQLFLVGIGASWLWMMTLVFGQPQTAAKALLVFIFFLACAAVAYTFFRHRPGWAILCLLLSISGDITVALALTRSMDLVYLYALPVLIAGALIHPRLGFLVAGVLDIALISLLPNVYGLARHAVLSPGAFFLINFTAVIAWAFTRNFYVVLEWMYTSYRLADERTKEAQEHRSRLMITLNDLDRAYYQLRRANEALAWARQQAEEARQAKARFVANVSHELRTPLNLIIGFSEMMVTAPESYGSPLPPAYRGDLNAIYRNARHLSALIDDVLDLSKIEADSMPLNKEHGDLRQIVEEATHMIRGVLEAKGLMFALELPPEPVPLLLDITRIRQVVLNLLSNAARFTEKGEITVRLAIKEGEATVTVSDTGPGIAPDVLPKVFEEFYQVDDSIRREHGGTGLGLAISKRFVELHGGRIWAESELGRGSTFGFSLPTSPVMEISPQYKPGYPAILPGSGAERILVIYHDDPSAAAMIRRHFEGYHVELAQSTAELPGMVTRLRPTAIVVDVGERSRVEAVLRAAHCNEVPVISFPLPTGPKMAMKLQTADYLLKPVTREALRRALDRISRPFSKVLIVDDDPAMVRLLTRMIRAERPHAQVFQAYGGVMALDIAHRERPDLMLLDLLMPGLDGIGVLAQMRKDPGLSDIPVIIVTATELGEQAANLSGEMSLTVPSPLPVNEWLRLLRSVTAALRPAPASEATSEPVPASAPLG